MRASYNWLRTLVPQLTATPEEVAKLLTSGGMEVEGIEHYGAGAEHCIVVAVRKVEPHPKNPKLRLVTVDTGGGVGPGSARENEQTVVCGAPNVPEPGGLVVLAPLGTILPAKSVQGAPFVIVPREIGGVLSEGMLCSEGELGLSGEGEGIMILPAGSASPGAPLTAVLPEASDVVFEIGLTPNRPDGLGHVGIARELAALCNFPWKRPEPQFPAAAADAPPAETLGASVRIAAPERCTHFASAVVTGVVVGESPAWLRYRLASLGVRSISNVVDVTNLVMLEWGHPMHAYDLDALTPLAQIGGLPDHATLEVRHAAAGEVLETLDGHKRELDLDDLVIADGASVVGLAGVMGGASSEVKNATTRLLLECAAFEPRGVRRTARRHGLHSEASHRFERGVDPSDVEQVLASAAQHLVRLAGGQMARGLVHAGGGIRFPRTITLRKARQDAILGHAVPWREGLGTLSRLGLVRVGDEDLETSATFEVPPHRPDLAREIDLIEEVVRVYGIDRIPARLPRIQPTRDVGGIEAFTERVRGVAASLGLSEAVLLSLTSAAAMKKAHAPEPTVHLKNPLTQEGGSLITSVVPGLLDAAARAARHGETPARLFAVQTVFTRKGPGELPDERLAFAAVLTGARPGWLEKPNAYDAWDAKGIAMRLVESLGGMGVTSQAGSGELHHPRARGELVLAENLHVASYGLLHPDVAEAYGLLGPVVVVTLDLQALARTEVLGRTFVPIPRFPASSRDLAVVVREGLAAGEVLRVLGERAGALAESVELFDRYSGKGVPDGHVSLGFRIVYRKADGTLTDAEVDGIHGRVVEEVTSRFGATVRA